MNIAAVIAAALICASLIILLKKNAPEFALPVTVTASVIILTVIISLSSGIFETITELSDKAEIDSTNIKILFKALGVCYITQIGRDACRDCGETSLGDKIDLAGKITIAALSMPMILQVLEIITRLVGK